MKGFGEMVSFLKYKMLAQLKSRYIEEAFCTCIVDYNQGEECREKAEHICRRREKWKCKNEV